MEQPAFGGALLPRAGRAAQRARGDPRQRCGNRGGHPQGQGVRHRRREQAQAGAYGIPCRQRVCRDAETQGFLYCQEDHRGVPALGRPAGANPRGVPPHAAVHRDPEPCRAVRLRRDDVTCPCNNATAFPDRGGGFLLAGASGAAPYGGNKRQNPPPPEKKQGDSLPAE